MSKVCQLFSGSSGNSILISSNKKTFLVDVGVSAKRCDKALMDICVNPDSISGIFVTHEHFDHTSGIRVFASRHNIPVFAPEKCLDSMVGSGAINEKVFFEKIGHHMELDGVEIKTFSQRHDSVDCVGYRFNLPDGRSVCVCTDTGYITDSAKEIMAGCDLAFVESNHETSMVEAGPYPYVLKKRILGERGHLSNFACSEYIKKLAQSGTTRFVLSHLSKENNMPHIARQSAVAALSEIGLKEGVDYLLYVSPPENGGKGVAL